MSFTAGEFIPSMFASKSLTTELWISLASLLRSHAAMHSIAQPSRQVRMTANSNAALELLGPNGKLSIVGPDTSGHGVTEFRPEAGEVGDEYSTFFFTEDGLICLEDSESPLEIEAAVELWLRKVQA